MRSSLELKEKERSGGAQESEVSESLQMSIKSRTVISVEFAEAAQPRALSPKDVMQLVKGYGSYTKAAEVLGASEAFVRLNAQKKRQATSHGF